MLPRHGAARLRVNPTYLRNRSRLDRLLHEMPVLVELGILLDVFVGVLGPGTQAASMMAPRTPAIDYRRWLPRLP